jgi:hypothetical protein
LPHVADPSADTPLEQLASHVFGDSAGVIDEAVGPLLGANRCLSLMPDPDGTFLEGGSCHGQELGQGGISVTRAVKQPMCNALPRLVIPTVWQDAACLLERNFHIRVCPVVYLFHERPRWQSWKCTSRS